VQKALGWTAEIVRRPPKVAPQEVMKVWIREWAKEGVTIDWQKLLPMEDSRVFLPRRWVVERTFSSLAQNRRLSKDYERLTETSEAFVYVAMTRLMVRRLACAWGFSDSFMALDFSHLSAKGLGYALITSSLKRGDLVAYPTYQDDTAFGSVCATSL